MAKQSKRVVFAVEPVRPVVVMDMQICVYQGEVPEGGTYDPATLLLGNGLAERFRAEWYNNGGTEKVKAALEAAGLHGVLVHIRPESGPGVILSNGEFPEKGRKKADKPAKADKPEAVPTVTATVTEDEEAGDEYDFSEFTDQELCDYATEHKVTGFSLGKGGKFSAKGRELLTKKIVAALTAEAAQAEAAPAKSDKKASKKKANKKAA